MIHLIQHHAAEGPGQIARWAAKRGIALELWRAELGQLPPLARLLGAQGLILLGGPASLLAPPPWLVEEQRWLAQALTQCQMLPVLGICLGGQLLAQSLGASVVRLAQPELGWCELAFDENKEFFLQWHEDSFALPPGAQWLASSAACPVQAFSHSRITGLQFHPEWDLATLTEMARAMALPAPLAQIVDADAEPSRQHFNAAHAWLEQLLDRLFMPAKPGKL